MSQAVIIGAGPAGLTAAYELSKSAMKSTILEADNQVGGLATTINYKGYRFDIGGHRFFTKIPYVQQIWEELLGDDLLLRSRLSRIYYRGKFFDYPLKTLNALIGLGPLEALLIGLSFVKGRLSPIREEKNFEQWISNRFGYRLYRTFFKTYTEKVWGIPCQEIAADWAVQRIADLSLSVAIRNALFANGLLSKKKTIKTLIDRFHYPRLGPGMMWERCKERLISEGNSIILNTRIKRICHRAGHIENVFAQTGNDDWEEFSGKNFISSMPLSKLIQALDPAAPDEILQAAKCLRYRDYLTILLIVNQQNIFPDNWIYIHSPDVKVGRIQNYKNWNAEMVPDSSTTSLGLEYFLWDSDEEWNWSDDQLIDFGIKECAQIGLINPSDVKDGFIVRMQNAYPIYDQNYQKIISRIKEFLKNFSNLQTIGRNGLHHYNNQDHSMLTGIYAARNLTGANYDVWSVNTEIEHLEDSILTNS